MVPEVEVVFCMDTEGPCADPDKPDLLATWDAVDAAMDKLFDGSFRARHPDSSGGVLKIGWFFLTWTGFTTNPRARAFGYHAVRDHYLERWGETLRELGDEQHWHYHHPPASGVGNEWGLDWGVGDEYARILSRQALERQWFPACHRAGGTIMDNHSSRWVDAWFPVDYSNRAPLDLGGLVDWSSGVAEWSLYHPSPEDFRSQGIGRRRMARCLDLQTDVHALIESDVVEAFERAESGKPALLACFDHDYRDIADRVDAFRELVVSVASRYPNIGWHYAAPLEAVHRYLDVPAPPRLELDVAHHGGAVHVRSSAPLFQSIPWLTVRTSDDEVVHVESDIVRLDPTRWRFTPPAELSWEELAVAGSTDLGATSVAVIGPDDGPGSLFLRRRTEESPILPRSIWDHSKYFVELCVARASGEAPEMDAVRQAVELLAPLLEPGMSVLDVGCAAGHLQRSFDRFGVEYHGIDLCSRAVEIGRLFGEERGMPASSVRAIPLEELPTSEHYDAVVCLSTLAFFPAFELPLEAMARAAERWLVVRASFGDETETRYLPDVLLEEGFQTLRAYMNVYSKRDVEMFLEREGFRVEWLEDARQRDRFNGRPEIVGGVELPYEFLFAERIAGSPSDEEILGEAFAGEARAWHAARSSG
jgi:methyltransferase family protein